MALSDEPALSLAQTEELFRSIGNVVVSFQMVELMVAEALTSVLEMRALEDRHLVLSAMGYRQKVDLLCELYPRKRTHPQGVQFSLVRSALLAAEEYRNMIVHSVWAIQGDRGWVRTKGSLRSKNGYKVVDAPVKLAYLAESIVALRAVVDWEFMDRISMEQALSTLKKGAADV